jgi:hypothetical protein
VNISEKLIEIQTTLVARKDLRNEFAKFNYRSLEGITEAVKPILKELGCWLIISDEMVEVGDRVYVKATATIQDSEGGALSATGYAREQQTKKGMDEAQITGAASSYARKYACNGLFAIDDTKDPDSADNKGDKQKGKEETASVNLKEGSIVDYINIAKDAIKSGTTKEVWWAQNKAEVIKACGDDGAKRVHAEAIK